MMRTKMAVTGRAGAAVATMSVTLLLVHVMTVGMGVRTLHSVGSFAGSIRVASEHCRGRRHALHRH
jgi:hypothetical protein